MCWLRIYFLCLVVTFCILFGVSHSTSDSICVLSDAPQQCGAFCLAALHPLYDQYSKSRQQEHSQEAMVKMIEDFRTEQKKIVNSEEAILKIIADSRAEQKELVNDSQEAMVKIIAESQAEQKEAMVKMIEDFRTEQKELLNHYYLDVRELLNELAANLTSTARRDESTLQSMPVTVPPGFQKIGSKYFLIEDNEWKTWTGAEETCREKGSHLATFRNEDEFEAVARRVHNETIFWLGYRRNSKGEMVRAAGKEESFMMRRLGELNQNGYNENVILYNLSIYYTNYKFALPFICQLDTVQER
ncbi:uncharacterized protein LOC26535431 [Drosophila yakuba]|uniref:C-type lectin domain-containing protein n=1 Tax=Drosophila yakuba TaxID=7245 RepID=A0A0R1DQ96_DROYA|nr:uncharacterized protein LOC26535431 [Drosophila yakuba]KRJ97097.1 uncharacterized protein Dyak_GE28250 [Drosophila yakuba]